MWNHILLGVGIYSIVVAALTWKLGGIFKRERAKLGLPIEHLRAAEAWYASHHNVEMLEAEVREKQAAVRRMA